MIAPAARLGGAQARKVAVRRSQFGVLGSSSLRDPGYVPIRFLANEAPLHSSEREFSVHSTDSVNLACLSLSPSIMRALSPKNLKRITLEVFTRTGVVGVLIFVSLVLPGLILRAPGPVGEDWGPRPEPGAEWLGFSVVSTPSVEFIPAPSVDVHLGLIRPWPPESASAAGDLGANAGESEVWLEPVFEAISWPKGGLVFVPPEVINGRLHYHVLPSFNFENNTLQWSGLQIRLWVNF